MKRLITTFLVSRWERAAMRAFVMGRYAEAEDNFRRIREAQPDKFAIGHNLGLVCLAQERHQEAADYFHAELDNFGETYMRVKALGDTYYIWGKREKCMEFYSRTLELCEHEGDRRLISRRMGLCADPATFAVAMESQRLLREGNRLMAEGDLDGSCEAFRKAAELDDSNFQAWNNLGALEMNHKKNIPASAEYFKKAVAFTSLQAIHNNLKRAETMTAPKEERNVRKRKK